MYCYDQHDMYVSCTTSTENHMIDLILLNHQIAVLSLSKINEPLHPIPLVSDQNLLATVSYLNHHGCYFDPHEKHKYLR